MIERYLPSAVVPRDVITIGEEAPSAICFNARASSVSGIFGLTFSTAAFGFISDLLPLSYRGRCTAVKLFKGSVKQFLICKSVLRCQD